MGSHFSAGPFRKEVEPFLNIQVTSLRAKLFHLDRLLDPAYEEAAFLTKKQIQLVFKLSERRVFDVFSVFDRKKTGRVSRQEFFGALALASCDTPSDKVGLGFFIADENKDNHLSQSEVETLLICATRGLSSMKGLDAPALKTIRKIVTSMFNSESVVLNEKGFINVFDMKAYCQVNDLCRTYFADLGTQVEVIDSSKLIAQRKNLLMDLLRMQSRLTMLRTSVGYAAEDDGIYIKERGGDYLLLKFDADDVQDEEVPQDDAAEDIYSRAKLKFNSDIEGGISEAQRLRRLRRRNADSKEKSSNILNDAVAFARGFKSKENTGGFSTAQKVIEQSIMFKWDTLEPQSSDKLVKLDLDIIEDLFEAAGIPLSDADAQKCLDSIPSNVLGRHSYSDLVRWYREYSKKSFAIAPQWRQFARNVGHYWEDTKQYVNFYRDLLWKQLEVLSEVSKSNDLVGSHANKEIAGGNETPVFRFSTEINAKAVFQKPTAAGFSRIQAWHRNQLLKPPTTATINAEFGVPQNIVLPEAPDKSGKVRSKAPPSQPVFAQNKNKEKTVPGQLKEGMKSGYRLQYILNPSILGTPFPPLLDPSDLSDQTLSKFPADLIPIDFLDRYKAIPAESVIWLAFNVVENVNYICSKFLISAASNFFNSIPSDHRKEFYTHVEAFILKVPKPGEGPRSPSRESREGGKSRKAKAAPVVEKKVLLVALYTENNFLRDFEDQLPAGILASRAVRKLDISIELDKSFDELFEESLKFVGFDRRLYGPQEDEIGEECMNPLKFAKMNKKRRDAFEDVLNHINTIDSEELKKHLNAHGLASSGTRGEIIEKVKKLFKRQIDMIGFGEISKFGDSMVRELFATFDLDKDGALSFWELNTWLFFSGSRTINNMKDYKSLINSLGLQVDRNDHVTIDGILAYYDEFGRLDKDIRALGFGSLNSILKGNLIIISEMDQEAFASLEQLFEKHSLFFPEAKQILAVLTSLHNFRLDGEYRYFGDIPGIRDNSELSEILSTPGWFADVINSFSSYLADRDEGLIRSIRLSALEKFGKYSLFDSAIHSLATLREPEEEANITDAMRAEDDEKVSELLPRVIDSTEIFASLESLYVTNESLITQITDQSSMASRNDREMMKIKLSEVDADITKLKTKLETCMLYIAPHATAFYDALHSLTNGPVCIGVGTKEMCFKMSCEGVTWTNLLPRARGEPCFAKRRELEKIERAAKRKKAAIAAIRRERARRNMTDEDKERLRLEKLEKARIQLEKQWQGIFNDAYGLLCDLREDKHDGELMEKMEKRWDYLEEFTEAKFERTLKHAATSSNLAVILSEFYQRDMGRRAKTLEKAKTGAQIVAEKMLNPFFLSTTVENEDGSTETTFSFSPNFSMDEGQCAAYMVLLQNYISHLRHTNDVNGLKKSREMISQIALLSDYLSDKDRSKISLERSLSGVHIMPVDPSNFLSELNASVEEGKKYLVKKTPPKVKEVDGSIAEAPAFSEEEEKMMLAMSRGESIEPVPLSKEEKKRLRKEKEAQREASAALRNETKLKAIEDRLKYYAMIQNDKISKLFHAVSSNTEMANKFSGLYGDNSDVRDVTERMNTAGHGELPTDGPKYEVVISVGGIDALTPRDPQDFSVNPLPMSKAELLQKEAEEQGLGTENTKEEEDDPRGGVPAGCGVAVAVRKDGATVREDIDIENSQVICTLRQQKKVFFDKRVVFWSKDPRCLPVERLHVFFTMGKELKSGWVSLTGRAPGDTHPLFRILKPCDPNLYAEESIPMTQEVPIGCGSAIVVRRDGATVRSGVSVDVSKVVMKLKYRQSVFFDKFARVMPSDPRTLPVIRMHVYITNRSGKVSADGWVSLTGRTRTDMEPIFKITRECTIGCPEKKRLNPFSWLFRNRAEEKKTESTNADGNCEELLVPQEQQEEQGGIALKQQHVVNLA